MGRGNKPMNDWSMKIVYLVSIQHDFHQSMYRNEQYQDSTEHGIHRIGYIHIWLQHEL